MNKNVVALTSMALVILAVILAFMKLYTAAWIVVGINVALLGAVIYKAGR